jgi:hypothetical protein
MDAAADWPSKVEELRFDPQDPSDATWHRYQDAVRHVIKEAKEDVQVILAEHRDALWAGAFVALFVFCLWRACGVREGAKRALFFGAKPLLRFVHTRNSRQKRNITKTYKLYKKGIRALADQRELLGSELRDVFDAHPPVPLDDAARAALLASGPTGAMAPLTGGRRDAEWPYGVEWLGDAYPLPYWVRKAREGAGAGATADKDGSGSGGGA